MNQKLLLKIKNLILTFIPENSYLFKRLVIIGIKINTRRTHRPLKYLKMGVHVTEHCNLNCRSCTALSPLVSEYFLDIESFEADLKKLSKITDGKMESFFLTGGEPLLHPKIEEIIFLARSYFPKSDFSIMTNGLILHQMADCFWQCCAQTSIRLLITRYPINIDIERIREKAVLFKVNLSYTGGDSVPVKSMWKYPLDLEGKQSLKNSFNICTQVNVCLTIKNGIIYPCNTIAGIEHFNRYFDKNLLLTSKDTLDINKVNNVEEIIQFLCTPKPFCKFCNRAGLELGLGFSTSKKEISEWV